MSICFLSEKFHEADNLSDILIPMTSFYKDQKPYLAMNNDELLNKHNIEFDIMIILIIKQRASAPKSHAIVIIIIHVVK